MPLRTNDAPPQCLQASSDIALSPLIGNKRGCRRYLLKVKCLRFFRRCAQQSGTAERQAMIDRSHERPITSQAKALNISRSGVYYRPRAVPAADLAIMRRMDELHLDFPFAGSRMLRDLLN